MTYAKKYKGERKSILQKVFVSIVTISTVWYMILPFGLLLPAHYVNAAAPTFLAANLKWKSTSVNVQIDFQQPVFNANTKPWGPQGKLDTADFTISGVGAPALSSVQHDGGGRYAILTFASAPPSATTITCAATAIYDEGIGGSPSACDGASVTLSDVTEDSTAPTISSVNVWGSNSFEVRFSEPMDTTTAGSRANYKLNTASTTDTYTGAAVISTEDVAPQDSYIWVQNWDPSVVMFDVWDGQIANNDTLTITTSVQDLFGNALAAESEQTLTFTTGGTTGGGSQSAEVLGAFFVDGTNLDLVFSKAMDETSSENTAFYKITKSNGTVLTTSAANLQADTKVVRVTVSGGTIVGTNFQNNPGAVADTVRVCTATCANGGPKDTDLKTQMTEWDVPIEPAVSGNAKIKSISVGTNGDVRVVAETILDGSKVAPARFTFKRDGTAISGLTISNAFLDWDDRTIVMNTSGAAIDDSNAATLETLVIDVTNNTGISDVFGTELIQGAAGTACPNAPAGNELTCSIDFTKPTVTKVVHTDVDSSGTINQNDTVDIYFSEDMNRYSAFSTWDFEVLYGASCTMALPTDSRANCNWGGWGNGATLNWDLPTPADTNTRIVVGNFPDVKADNYVVPWTDPWGYGGVKSAKGNPVGNVGVIAVADTSAPTISAIQVTSADATVNVGDTIKLTFSEAMDQTSVTTANISTDLALNNGHTWGNSTLVWVSSGQSLTITVGATSTAAAGDVIDPSSTVKDLGGNAIPAAPGAGRTITIPTLSGPTLVTGAGGSAGNTKLYLKFSEAVVNVTQAYPSILKTLPNKFGASPSAVAVANFGFTDANAGGVTPSKIDYISRDGKEIILNMGGAVAGADTLNLVAGALLGGISGAASTVNDTLTNLSVDLTDTTGPTISSIGAVTKGSSSFDPSMISTVIVSGDKIILEMSESVNPGSLFNLANQNAPALNLDVALPITAGTGACGASGCTWGDGAKVTFLSLGVVPNAKIEITLGVPSTGKTLIANGNVVAPTSITDYVGNAGTGTASINTTPPDLVSIVYVDVDTSATVTQNDTVAFTFNTPMDAATADFAANTDKALWAEVCDQTGCTNKTWGSGVATAWSNSNKTLTVTLGSSPTIAQGNMIWFEPMYIHTASFGNIFRPGVLDFTGPSLLSIKVVNVDGAGTTLAAADQVFFNFSEPILQSTITGANVATVLAPSGGSDWGATPTLEWLSQTILMLSVANAPSGTVTLGTTTVNPTNTVTDVNGNIDATAAGVVLTQLTIAPPTTVVLTDADTTNPGLDKTDITVSWTAPTAGTVNHYRVYLLPQEVALNTETQYQLNSSPVTTTSFAGTSSTYAIYDDSRFEFLAANVAPAPGTQFYPLMPNTQYMAYVVACDDASCTNASMPGASAPTQLTPDNFNFGGGGAPPDGGGGTFNFTFGKGSGLPFVEGTLPFSGKIDVPINTKLIGAKFSDPLDSTTVTSTTFKVESDSACDGTYEGTVAGTLAYNSDGWAVSFTPSADLTASACFQIHTTTGIESEFGVAMASDYYSTFETGSSSDTTAPSISGNKFQFEGIATNAVSPTIPEISIQFNEDMDPTTFTTSTVTLATSGSLSITPASVEYNPFSRMMNFWLAGALPASTAIALTLDGASITDSAGNPLGSSCTGCTLNFTTSTLSTTAPQISWADGDAFHVSVGFNDTMKESTVVDSGNWQLKDSSSVEVSLTGKNLFYDPFSKELHIDGLSLTDNATYTIAVRLPDNAVKGLNNIAVDTTANSKSFTVHSFSGAGGGMDCGLTSFTFGCGMDNATNVFVMAFMPINVWPQNQLAGQTSKYFIDIPTTKAIDNGGKIILAFPTGFDVSNAAAVSADDAWSNKDLNGPGPNTVTISAVTANKPSTGSIEITLAVSGTGSTGANDFLHLDLSGIKNTSDASTVDFRNEKGGYTVTVSTKDSTGKTLDSNLKSMPFPINKAGNGRIAGYVKDSSSTAISGAQVFLDSPRGGHFEFTTDASGRFTFGGLPIPETAGTANDSFEYWLFVQPPAGQGYMSGSGFSVQLSDETAQVTEQTITIEKGTSVISGTITHLAALNGKEVEIYANGPSGWTNKKITLANATSTAYSISVSKGDWNIGVNMWVPPDMFGGGTFVQATNFMSPPPQFVTISADTLTGVNFTLTSLASTDTITGTVTDQDGSTLSGVDVWAHSSGFSDAFAQTQPDGTYTLYLPAGTYKVGAGKPGLKNAPEVQVTAPMANVNFTLKKGNASVKGSVLDASGNAIVGASVSFFSATTGEFYDAFTNDSGYFTAFPGAGTWKVEARHPQFGTIATSTGADNYTLIIVANDALTQKDFKVGGGGLITMRNISGYTCGSFSGSTCATGKARGDVTISAIEVDSTGKPTGRGASTSSKAFDGSYTVSVPANSGTNTYNIEGSTKYGPLKKFTGIDVSAADVTAKNWTIQDATAVTINFNGVPPTYENDTGTIKEAVLHFLDTASGKEKKVYVKDANTWTTKVLPSNQYDVKAYVPGFGEMSPDATSLTNGFVKVSEGTPATINFTLTATTITIAGTITDSSTTGAINDAWVTVLDNTTGLGYQIETESDGTFTIEVPDGDYSLEVGKSAHVEFENSTNITDDVTNLAISLDPTGATISGTAYESNGTTAVEKGYVTATEFGGTGSTGAPIINGAFTLDVEAGTTWDLEIRSGSGKEEANTVRVNAGETTTQTLVDSISGYTITQSYQDSVTPNTGKTIDDTANNNLELNAKPGDLGTSATSTSVSIETDPAIHETDSITVFGTEKSIEVNGGKTSTLSNAVDMEVVYDKADVDAMIADTTSGMTSANVDDKLDDLQLMSWDDSKGASGDWVLAPTIQRVEVDAVGGTATFAYENFDTFITNIGTDVDYYDDYKVELVTATPHMTIWGTQTQSDNDAPAVPGAPTATGGASSITVDWTAYSAPSDILEYEVYRTTSGVFSELNGQACLASTDAVCQVNQSTVTSKSAVDTNVRSNQIYYYAITAVDLSHNGDTLARLSAASSGASITGGSGGGGGGGGGGGAVPSPTPESTVPTTTTGDVTATADKGGVTTRTTTEGSYAKVTIPANTVAQDTAISVVAENSETVTSSRPAPSDKSVVGNEVYNFTASYAGYEVTNFSKNLTLEFSYTDSQVSGLNVNSLKVYYYDTLISAWVSVPSTIDVVNKKVTASVNHFTYFVLMGDPEGEVELVDVSGGALLDGDLVTTSDSFDIYIASFVPSTGSGQAKRFKRLILNPEIFNSYGHLSWDNVKTISQAVQDQFTLSDLVIEVNADGSVADEKVYKVSSAPDSDVGQKQWLNMTAAQFELEGYDWDAIAKINHTEASEGFYPTGVAITSSL